MYNTVTGGVPSEDDVVAAIDDLESLYASCHEQGRLADPEFSFMTAPLMLKDIVEIVLKLFTPPAERNTIPLGMNTQSLIGRTAPASVDYADLLCTYAALVLHDGEAEITPENMRRLIVAAGCQVEGYWPTLYCRMINSVGMPSLIALGSHAGAGGGPVSAFDPSQPAAGAPGGGGASGEQEKKTAVEEEEEEEEMDFGLFD